MASRFVNVGIAVRDIEEAIAFFELLGLTVTGRAEVGGEWSDVAVDIDGNHAQIAMLELPDGSLQLELFEYLDDLAIETAPTRANEIGMHRLSFLVDDLDATLAQLADRGYRPLRGVARYEDLYRLTYLRGPSGTIVMLSEDLRA
jgi:glyoxylase I family protein